MGGSELVEDGFAAEFFDFGVEGVFGDAGESGVGPALRARCGSGCVCGSWLSAWCSLPCAVSSEAIRVAMSVGSAVCALAAVSKPWPSATAAAVLNVGKAITSCAL